MGKFCKTGKVVVILNGRHAGTKGIIVRSNYDGSKDRPYPHCLIVGLSKGPRKVTKRNLSKLENKIKLLESKEGDEAKTRLNDLKRFGVFFKTYNMSHLLVTRYNIKEDFSMAKTLDNLDNVEANVKKQKADLDTKEKAKDPDKAQIEKARTEFTKVLQGYKEEVKAAKTKIGTEMYKRFMKGFVRSGNADANEKQEHTEFLFKKLKF